MCAAKEIIRLRWSKYAKSEAGWGKVRGNVSYWRSVRHSDRI